jgi:hypothetical protein
VDGDRSFISLITFQTKFSRCKISISMSLYASRDGAIYQSYDDFAGMQGFHEASEPSQLFDPVR